jgi:hypothetical protein
LWRRVAHQQIKKPQIAKKASRGRNKVKNQANSLRQRDLALRISSRPSQAMKNRKDVLGVKGEARQRADDS